MEIVNEYSMSTFTVDYRGCRSCKRILFLVKHSILFRIHRSTKREITGIMSFSIIIKDYRNNNFRTRMCRDTSQLQRNVHSRLLPFNLKILKYHPKKNPNTKTIKLKRLCNKGLHVFGLLSSITTPTMT